jgi:hypothetical protein
LKPHTTKLRSFLVISFAVSVFGQTQINLREQARVVDFSQASWTKPFKTGLSLPALCSTGEIFYKLDAALGMNLYGCNATNTWTRLSGAGLPSAASEGQVLTWNQANSVWEPRTFSGISTTWQGSGVTVASRPVVDLYPGLGLIHSLSDSGTKVIIQQSADTALLLTNSAYQHANPLYCLSQGNSGTAYSCLLTPTLTHYSTPLMLLWRPDVTNTGAPTLDVDLLGVKTVLHSDGTSLAAGDLQGGQIYPIWYDGTQFRLLESFQTGRLQNSSRPVCSAEYRGRLWLTPGANSVQDSVTVCAKDSADTYAWRVLY